MNIADVKVMYDKHDNPYHCRLCPCVSVLPHGLSPYVPVSTIDVFKSISFYYNSKGAI